MQNVDEISRDYYRRIIPPRVENAEDTELAYRVQNSSRGDPDLLRAIVDRYTGSLSRWIAAYLFFLHNSDPSPEEVNRVLLKVFNFASLHTDQFHGQASLLNWLLAVCNTILGQLTRKDHFLQWVAKINANHGKSLEQQEISWIELREIPEKQRNILILKYLLDMDLADLSSIFYVPAEQIQRYLVQGRELLMVPSNDQGMNALLQAYMDGLYDDVPDELNKIEQHIKTCSDCQAYLSRLNHFERSLSSSLQAHWPINQYTLQDRDELLKQIFTSAGWVHDIRKIKVNIRQAAWIVSLLAVLAGLAIVFVRMTATEKEFPQVEATPTPQLPPLIKAEPVTAGSQNPQPGPASPQYIEQALSSDGKWSVFTSINTDVTGMQLAVPAVTLYNREKNTFEVISENSSVLNVPWVWTELAPSISGNGQRIVYVNSSNNPDISGYPCDTPDHQACLDIFLYDQSTGSTKRITQAISGGAADGESLAPTISEDGNWVAFWSAADNLVDVNKDICQSSATGITCLYIYLYNVQTMQLQQIPIRNQARDDISGVDRISLSADGRYVGFTLFKSALTSGISPLLPTQSSGLQFTIPDSITKPSIPFINQPSEVVVFDRQTSVYELENVAPDGTAGNGPSSSPVLSADGRYVAFVTFSSNLVGGDYNYVSDVFVRDRHTGEVELASVSSQGSQGNHDSGLIASMRGFYSINLSSDGRYVVFQSMADNLGRDVQGNCTPQSWIGLCNFVYVHDRLTGETDSVVVDTSQSFSFFPAISDDGRWVSFSQSSYNCSPSQFVCSNVMLYDRQANWMSNLTNFTQESNKLPWMYFTSLSLPWQSWESRGLAFSPDGIYMAVGGFDSKIRIWHLQDGVRAINRTRPDTIIETGGSVASTTMEFSADNLWLAAGSNNGVVHIWQLVDGRLLYTLNDQIDPVEKIRFSSDGSHLLIATQYQLSLWSIADRELVKESVYPFGESAIYALDISPTGDLLATGHGDGTVWLQYIPSGKVIARLGGQQLAVSHLSFSHDGSILAARSGDGKINLWSISLQNPESPSISLLNTIQSSDVINDLVFSADDKYLAATGLIGTIGLWSVPDGKNYTLTPSVSNGMVYAVAFSYQDGTLAAMFENSIEFWRLPPKYISLFFTPAQRDIFINAQPFPKSTANDYPELNNYFIGGMLSIDQAASKLQFPLIVPNHMPGTFIYLGATINTDGSVWLRYVNYGWLSYQAIIYIYEKVIGDTSPPTMTIGASASVLPVRLDTFTGETNADYVSGDWSHSYGYTYPDYYAPTGDLREVWRWDNSLYSQRLRWVEAGVFIAIYYQVKDYYVPILSTPSPGNQSNPVDTLLSQQDLVQIASGMQWYIPDSSGSPSDVSSGVLSGFKPHGPQ